MRKFLITTGAAFLMAFSIGLNRPAFGQEHEGGGHGEHGAKGDTVTLKGEVLDLYCFLGHGAKGAKHAKCATACINKGIPPGFLSDGKVYLLLGADHGPANKLVADHAGKPVSITGKLVENEGLKAIQVEKIEEDSGHGGKAGGHEGHGH